MGEISESTNLHELPGPAATDHRGDNNSLPALGAAINVLMIWPRFPSSFWSFRGMMDIIPEESVHPPLGLLTVAALSPPDWKLRLIDRSFEDLLDSDILWADLVMVSGMRVQREDIRATLLRARALGKRTIVGGPYASSEPEVLLSQADHVVVGEPDEIFNGIAADLERGSALLSSYRRAYWKFLYQILKRWSGNSPKLNMGLSILLSGHHFTKYAQEVAAELEHQYRKLAAGEPAERFGSTFDSPDNFGASLTNSR